MVGDQCPDTHTVASQVAVLLSTIPPRERDLAMASLLALTLQYSNCGGIRPADGCGQELVRLSSTRLHCVGGRDVGELLPAAREQRERDVGLRQ